MPKLTIDTLNKDRLRDATRREVFEQGQVFFQRGRVEVKEVREQFALCHVQDVRVYPVEVEVDDRFLYLKCGCEEATLGLICRHDIAAGLAVYDYLKRHQPPDWRTQFKQLLQIYREEPRRRAAQTYLLYFSLQKITSRAQVVWKLVPYQLPLAVLSDEIRSAVEEEGCQPDGKCSDPPALQTYIENSTDLTLHLKTFTASTPPDGCYNLSPETIRLANHLVERAKATLYSETPYPIPEFMALFANQGSPLYFGSPEQPLQKKLQVLTSRGQIRLQMERTAAGLRLFPKIGVGSWSFAPPPGGPVEIIHLQPCWLLAGRLLFELAAPSCAFSLAPWFQSSEITIPAQDEGEFLEKYYLPNAQELPIDGESLPCEEIQADPAARLYLNDEDGELQVELRFGYGKIEVPYEPQPPFESYLRQEGPMPLVRVKRCLDQEMAAFQGLIHSNTGLRRNPARAGLFYLKARLHPLDFLIHKVPPLVQAGFEIYGEEQLKLGRVNRNRPALSLSVSSGIDWFDVRIQIQYGENEISLQEIRRMVRKNQRFIKLADGSMGEIPAEWLERYRHLFSVADMQGEEVRLGQHQLGLLDEWASQADQVQADPEFHARCRRLRALVERGGLDPQPLPGGFTGELRPYQKAGYDWLHFLKATGFSGCLADDMGLGKTVQVLVFLQSLYEGWAEAAHLSVEAAQSRAGESNPHAGLAPQANQTPQHASLVVVPRSLLVNWQREASRFTPGLKLLEHFDIRRERDVRAFDAYQLVITTYGVMLRDIELLQSYPFEYILLDESQAIKNPLSLTARAARRLHAQRRLVLTGTPVENSTIELWSQFAFLNPGLLGNLEYFRNSFASPIEKDADQKAAKRLRQLVYPFILRRTKSQVAPELPPRTERMLYCDMEPAQRRLYNRTRDYYRDLVATQGGGPATRMKILEGLLRLRQIANHPRLVDEDFHGESGKFELLLETLSTLRAEGHKALVFSQFVQMLRLLREVLDERRIAYAYLDGHTHNRQERVDEFQTNPELPLFLISLKAGGTGLNLTAADYVLHIDPWWNPAVEMQASDRAHRIGQDKPVFIYRLVARDTVEEKILTLQEHKKNLAAQLVTTEKAFFKSLTPGEVQALFQ